MAHKRMQIFYTSRANMDCNNIWM